MQYKDFIFPHNPAVITLRSDGRHAAFFCPGYGDIVQPLGDGARQVICAGSFVCASALQAQELLARFKEKTSGVSPGALILPGFEPMLAVLAESSFEARGEGRVLPYTMRFVESPARGSSYA